MQFIVTRDCCTSGNCDTCHGKTPVGKTMRVVQWGPTSDETKAKRVAENWRQYNAAVRPHPEFETVPAGPAEGATPE